MEKKGGVYDTNYIYIYIYIYISSMYEFLETTPHDYTIIEGFSAAWASTKNHQVNEK